MRIFFSNIGYAKGIDGSLLSHLLYFHRHFYTGINEQRKVLAQLKTVIAETNPDICCFVEIDSGSLHSAQLNQIEELITEDYPFYDIAGKYGTTAALSSMPLHYGKSNGFIARQKIDFEQIYFRSGTKKLIYKLKLEGLSLFFAHFSLSEPVRQKQMLEISDFVRKETGEVMVLADFNVFKGFSELEYLTAECGLKILNKETEHTFFFHKNKMVLDLCLCTKKLATRARLEVIPQPYSDHAALLVEVEL